MDVSVLCVPYDSGQRGMRMGAGPLRLLDLGLAADLQHAGHRVSITEVTLPRGLPEIAAAFTLAREVADAVRAAAARGDFPLVLSGNCNSCLGTVTGLRVLRSDESADLGVLWCDAHADFNTPETTISGFLDGMALATLVGDCWAPLAASIRGFQAQPTESVVLYGSRALDARERDRLDERGILVIEAGAEPPIFRAMAEERWRAVDGLYVHVDLDVLDPSAGRANAFAAPGGASLSELLGRLTEASALRPIRAAALTAYDPAADEDGRAGDAARTVVAHVVALAARAGRSAT